MYTTEEKGQSHEIKCFISHALWPKVRSGTSTLSWKQSVLELFIKYTFEWRITAWITCAMCLWVFHQIHLWMMDHCVNKVWNVSLSHPSNTSFEWWTTACIKCAMCLGVIHEQNMPPVLESSIKYTLWMIYHSMNKVCKVSDSMVQQSEILLLPFLH